jgi:hypothetical protein
MSLLVPWLVFPLLVGALAYGCGLAVWRIAGIAVPGALIPPLGLAMIIVTAQIATTFDATAELAAPLVAALAIAGVVISRGRDRPAPTRWELCAALGAFAVFALPIVASGDATVAGYMKLEDGSTFLALTDSALHAGQHAQSFAPASYVEHFIHLDYPIASFLPFGVAGQLLGQEIAWLIQPYLALLAGMLALALQPLCAPAVESPRRRALVAFVAAQAALLFGFAMWGGVKELSAALLIPFAAALLPGAARSRGWRSLLPPAIATAATVSALSIGGIAWLGVPLAVTLATVARGQSLRTAAGRALSFAAVSGPLLVTALPNSRIVADASSRAPLTKGDELGTLPQALNPLQVTGVWLGPDFRFRPTEGLLTLLLAILVLAGAAAGAWVLKQKDARGPLLYASGAIAGCIAIVIVGGPWLDAKALATVSPLPVLLAMIAGAHATENGRRLAGWCMVTLVAAGVLGSNALAYTAVTLAPRDRLDELSRIGKRFAHAGPALLTRAEPYANRYFLRDVGADNAAEVRWYRPIKLVDGRTIPKWRSVDIDELHPASVARYRLLVLRRSPVASRPPSNFHLIWSGHWYDVWRRAGPPARARLALGGDLESGGIPSCAALKRFASLHRGSELAAATAQKAVVARLASRLVPPRWRSSRRFPGAAIPRGSGTVDTAVRLPHRGRWRVWVGGAVPGQLTLSLDGRPIGKLRDRLNRPQDYEPVATRYLTAGRHRFVLRYEERLLAGRSRTLPLGPLALSPVGRPAQAAYLARRDVGSLCGRRLDWVEAVRAPIQRRGLEDRRLTRGPDRDRT